MDGEPEELQFLGFLGIYKESYKIIFTWRKLFSRITVALILPLSLLFLSHDQISDLIFTKNNRNQEALDNTREGSPKQDEILRRLSSEYATFQLFKIAYLVVVLVLSLLSTSAVVYTVACIYSAKEITFRKVMFVVPKVWRRLMVTFLWGFIIILGYNILTILIMALLLALAGLGTAGLIVLVALLAVYSIGFVYISVVWHLAIVVSALENMYGITATQKSRALIKGKTWAASAIFLKLSLSLLAILLLFGRLVVHGETLGAGARVGYGVLIFLGLAKLILVGLVVQTVIYFVCKSYHHENIDKSCLADHLEVYLGKYVPLKETAVQLEQLYA